MSGPDYIVEIGSQGTPALSVAGQQAARPASRKWKAILWRCCQVYSRVYRNPPGTAYEGRCPRCGRGIELRIGPGGTDARFFEAG